MNSVYKLYKNIDCTEIRQNRYLESQLRTAITGLLKVKTCLKTLTDSSAAA